MKPYIAQAIYLGTAILASLTPATSVASDSWTGFVPPSSKQGVTYNNPANLKSVKWQKASWRSGANFEPYKGKQFDIASSNVVDAKQYALTQPQRKSVNPWKVNPWRVNQSWSSNRQYKFGPTKRPWGSVPQQFQKRAASQPVNQMQPINRNFMHPTPNYRPYMNNNLLSHSSSLLPVGGPMPFYSNPTYLNNVPFFASPYRNSNAYLWR